MMKFLVTGERGFIGRNLVRVAEERGHEVFRLCTPDIKHSLVSRRDEKPDPGFFWREPCVFSNSAVAWAREIEKHNVDVVIHNAAVVGTDVVGLNPLDATLSNIAGTYNIVQACELAGVPISYMGTTVIYDTPKYQNSLIDEDSDVKPITLYGQLKYTGDMIVREAKVDSNIIRPLFAYGGVGDMNSLIAKSCFAAFEGRDKLDMFLDPKKHKDYLHVDDYCTAVIMAAEQNLWQRDFIVAAEDPQVTGEIVKLVDEIVPSIVENFVLSNSSHAQLEKVQDQLKVPSEILRWHPETDYLGNHRLSSKSFREASGWSPSISLKDGIRAVAKDILSGICEGAQYDPLKHLDEANRRNLDLTKLY